MLQSGSLLKIGEKGEGGGGGGDEATNQMSCSITSYLVAQLVTTFSIRIDSILVVQPTELATGTEQ